MIEDEYDEWEQKKQDVMYLVATGRTDNLEQRIEELLGFTFSHWRNIRECEDKPVCPVETGQVVHSETIK